MKLPELITFLERVKIIIEIQGVGWLEIIEAIDAYAETHGYSMEWYTFKEWIRGQDEA